MCDTEYGPYYLPAENPLQLSWKRSQRDNIYCYYRDLRLTVFQKDDDLYWWCVADGDTPMFSPCGYRTESEAIEGLKRMLARMEEAA